MSFSNGLATATSCWPENPAPTALEFPLSPDRLLFSTILGPCQSVRKWSNSIALDVLGLETGFAQLADDAAGVLP